MRTLTLTVIVATGRMRHMANSMKTIASFVLKHSKMMKNSWNLDVLTYIIPNVLKKLLMEPISIAQFANQLILEDENYIIIIKNL